MNHLKNGLYDLLLNRFQAKSLDKLDAEVRNESLDSTDSHLVIGKAFGGLLSSALKQIRNSKNATSEQIKIVNYLVSTLVDQDAISLADGEKFEDLVSELNWEFASCQSIDLVCAFIRFSGLRLFTNRLKEFFDQGGKMRVLTTV